MITALTSIKTAFISFHLKTSKYVAELRIPKDNLQEQLSLDKIIRQEGGGKVAVIASIPVLQHYGMHIAQGEAYNGAVHMPIKWVGKVPGTSLEWIIIINKKSI